ncbi:PO21 protein, partial [Turnix velox]|nr:PO21 protein [Turnix velox]
KAFDTVSHQHIIAVLEQTGVDEHIITLIKYMYRNITTHIDLKSERSEAIGIGMGVKQGDLMSLILFNLSIDPLLCKLEEQGEGFQHCGHKITSMAFADDLVLISRSWEGMPRNINIVETFCDLTGLREQSAT